MTRILIAAAALLLGLLAAGPTSAQISVTRTPATSPVIGRVVRGSAATTFSVSTAGVVTRTSGNAIRLSTTSVTPPTVTISCGTGSACNNNDVRVTITATGASDDGSISRFRVGSLTGATYRTLAPAEGASLVFDLRPLGMNRSASFVLGMDVLLAAASDSGTDTFTYTVTVAFR
ncbi:hypothetical protein GGQ87_001946 [Brevundimonas alba]|uniref:DUF4402 domain-containing protein n=1 Tax=Brevundimonas alba TaxID=74314 RepID=A0A7X5YKP4_9CAUL|nr:hypothetical protein [Brevundimonas alba]NJC41688.1 hypothetical protein [Brevundimonas alba]